MSEADLGGTALAWLLGSGVLSGAASIWALRRWSDGARSRVAVNRVLAHLMEFRLFADEPALILRAQGNLLKANATMLRVLLGPSLILLLPFVLMFAAMEGFFSRAALRTGEAAVVTMQGAADPRSARLQAPEGIAVETPPVAVPRDRQVSWRVRPLRDAGGVLRLQWDGAVLRKSITAGGGLHWISPQRSASLLAFLLHPTEAPIAERGVDWVRVEYPGALVLGFHWLFWYSAAACMGALLTFWRSSRA